MQLSSLYEIFEHFWAERCRSSVKMTFMTLDTMKKSRSSSQLDFWGSVEISRYYLPKCHVTHFPLFRRFFCSFLRISLSLRINFYLRKAFTGCIKLRNRGRPIVKNIGRLMNELPFCEFLRLRLRNLPLRKLCSKKL